MRGNDFLDKLDLVDPAYVEAADVRPRAAGGWIRWAALAACLCLVAGLAAPGISGRIFEDKTPDPAGGDPVSPGSFPDGIDPIIASLAVFPASERLEDVVNATIESIDEETAYGFANLGTCLPTWLPEGYHFGKASLYETTMQDGTQYHMLRVTYTTGTIPPTVTAPGDGTEVTEHAYARGDSFSISIYGFRPDTEQKIYSFGELGSYLAKKEDTGFFLFSCKDVYVGFSPTCLSAAETLDVIDSIP